ncbi:VOC family protein [Ralstonia sp. 25C]|uniref:VOC family protein n=1 Tax=Ralstonia sp. 25C TaxID=3447363 RepID=UPI003F7508C3
MASVINWFEIPANDFPRAVKFYENVFDTQLKQEDMGDLTMGVFPAGETTIHGALVKGEGFAPSDKGSVIYLNAPDLDAVLERVNGSGGQCVFGPMTLPDHMGRIAHIVDTEGNRIGLHEPDAKTQAYLLQQ